MTHWQSDSELVPLGGVADLKSHIEFRDTRFIFHVGTGTEPN